MADLCPVCLVCELPSPTNDARLDAKRGRVQLGPCKHVVCSICAPAMIQLGMQIDHEYPRCEICATTGSTSIDTTTTSASCKDAYGIGWLCYEALDALHGLANSSGNSASVISDELMNRYVQSMISVALRNRGSSRLVASNPLNQSASQSAHGPSSWKFLSDSSDGDASASTPSTSSSAIAAASAEADGSPVPLTVPQLHRQVSEVTVCPHCSWPMTHDPVDEPLRVDCIYCKRHFCCACAAPWQTARGDSHFGVACDEFAELCRGIDGADAARRAFLASLSPEMAATIGKPCPRCGMINVHFRDHGCHHTNSIAGCPRCGYGYCYVCLGPWPCASGCPNMCDLVCDCPTCIFCKPGARCSSCSGSCPACGGETDEQRLERERQQLLARSSKVAMGWIGPRTSLNEEQAAALKTSEAPVLIVVERFQTMLEEALNRLSDVLYDCICDDVWVESTSFRTALCVATDATEYLAVYRAAGVMGQRYRALQELEAGFLGKVSTMLQTSCVFPTDIIRDIVGFFERKVNRSIACEDTFFEYRLYWTMLPFFYKHRCFSLIIRFFVLCSKQHHNLVPVFVKTQYGYNWYSVSPDSCSVPFDVLLHEDVEYTVEEAAHALYYIADMANIAMDNPWQQHGHIPVLAKLVDHMISKYPGNVTIERALVAVLLSVGREHDSSAKLLEAYAIVPSGPLALAADVAALYEGVFPRPFDAEGLAWRSESGLWPGYWVSLAVEVANVRKLHAARALTPADAPVVASIASNLLQHPLRDEHKASQRAVVSVFYVLDCMPSFADITLAYLRSPIRDNATAAALVTLYVDLAAKAVQRVAMQDSASKHRLVEEATVNKNDRTTTTEECKSIVETLAHVLVTYLELPLTDHALKVFKALEQLLYRGSTTYVNVPYQDIVKVVQKRFWALPGASAAVAGVVKRVSDATDALQDETTEWSLSCLAILLFPASQNETKLDADSRHRLEALHAMHATLAVATVVARGPDFAAFTYGCKWLIALAQASPSARRCLAEHEQLIPVLVAQLASEDHDATLLLNQITRRDAVGAAKMTNCVNFVEMLSLLIAQLPDSAMQYSLALVSATLRLIHTSFRCDNALLSSPIIRPLAIFDIFQNVSQRGTPAVKGNVFQLALSALHYAAEIAPHRFTDCADANIRALFDEALQACAGDGLEHGQAMREWFRMVATLASFSPKCAKVLFKEITRVASKFAVKLPLLLQDVDLAKAGLRLLVPFFKEADASPSPLSGDAAAAVLSIMACAAHLGSPNRTVCEGIAGILTTRFHSVDTSPFAALLLKHGATKDSNAAAHLRQCERVVGLLEASVPAGLLGLLISPVRISLSTFASHIHKHLGPVRTTLLMAFAGIR